MTLNQRIKYIREMLGLSQAKFAIAISISNGYIAGLELGKRKVNDRIIKLICSEFNVNERWLRYEEGMQAAHRDSQKRPYLPHWCRVFCHRELLP